MSGPSGPAEVLEELGALPGKLATALHSLQAAADVSFGCSEKDAVYREDKLTLYRYRPIAPSAGLPPVLIVYALVNRPYMMDLQPDRSLIRRLLELGVDIYLIDWGYPDGADRFTDLNDYINGYLHRSLDVVLRTHQIPSATLLGVCQGGTFGLCYAALHPERVRNLITMVTPVDFQTPDNLLSRWMQGIDADALVAAHGVVPGAVLNAAYVSLLPFRLLQQKYVNLLDAGEDQAQMENFMRMEKWIFDSPGQAGAAFAQFARWFFQENRLLKGTLEIGGRKVDLKNIKQPVLNIYGKQDHLVPPAASTALEALVGTTDYVALGLDVGHIGMYVSGRSQRDLPQAITHWLTRRQIMNAKLTPLSPVPSTARLRELDLAHHLPAQQNYRLMQTLGGSRIITRAEGCFIHDADGNKILDGMAGLWCVNVGYGRSELAEVAREQMLQLPFYNTFFRTATVPAVQLATKIASLTGGDLQHVFFSSSGSEANDTAFRMVRHYWDLRGQPKRKIFISRWNAYHGSTVAAASLGGMKHMHAQGDLPIPGIEHIMQPYKFGDGFSEGEEAFATRAADALEQRILELGPERVAAFIGEPVQGAGGVIIPSREYWQRVGAICKKYGVLLVADEVICGFGRLGQWFGFQHFGLKPDLVTMAKGLSSGYLPISATVVSHEIIELLRAKDSEFFHGYTYSGHPTCAAVALRNIEIMEREGLVQRTAEILGPYFSQALQRLRTHAIVGETRSLGLIGAVEIVRQRGTNLRFGDKEGTAGPVVRDRCIANGLMVRAVRDAIVICPPLIITQAEIDQLVGILDKSLTEAAAALS